MKYLVFPVVAVCLFACSCLAEDVPQYELSIQNHSFEPNQLEIPSGKKVKLVVHNKDATPEEFESYDLNREKIVTPGGKISLFVGPLDPGEYKFFGEFHQETAQGKIVVR